MKNNQPAEGSQEAVHQVRLPVSKSTIDLVADLIRKQRKRLGTRWRKVTPGTQAIIVLAVLRHDQRLLDMAGGNDVSASTVRRWVIEVIGLLSARAPRLDRALKKIADDGGVVVPLDGTLVRTRRRTGTENRKNYSGKDKSHGLLFLALTDENLIWISVAKPGRSSEITTARHNKLTERLREAKLGALADFGFVGLDDDPDNPVIITGRKATRNHRLTAAEKEANRLLSRERAAVEHGIANLKTRRFLSKVRMNTRHATVAVPTKDALDRVDGDARRLMPILRESLQKLATEAGLNSYEIPRDLLVETEPFTQENRLLSGVRKPLRPALTKRYGERLEALYAQLSDREAEELRMLRQTGTDQPVPATVLRAAQALLGLEEGVVELGTRFLELGGDSLTALSFSQLLKETFHVDVPVDVVINPVNSLRQVADHIERALASEHRRPTADSVHGPDATRLDAADLRLDAFLDARTIARAERPAGPLPEARTVLRQRLPGPFPVP
ncbi:transposase family protein [Streptomyces sp. NPDC048155]|uniref:transposase family protein n=1 Tax=Streptomyces sp. NPDC048155 TaxID=3154818 RepID=UPI0033EFC460